MTDQAEPCDDGAPCAGSGCTHDRVWQQLAGELDVRVVAPPAEHEPDAARDTLEAAGHGGAHGHDWPEIGPALAALAAERDRLAAAVQRVQEAAETLYPDHARDTILAALAAPTGVAASPAPANGTPPIVGAPGNPCRASISGACYQLVDGNPGCGDECTGPAPAAGPRQATPAAASITRRATADRARLVQHAINLIQPGPAPDAEETP